MHNGGEPKGPRLSLTFLAVTFNNTFALLRGAALSWEMDFPVLMSEYFNVSSKWQLHFWHSETLSPSQTLEQEVCLRDNISILPPRFEWCSDYEPLCHWHEKKRLQHELWMHIYGWFFSLIQEEHCEKSLKPWFYLNSLYSSEHPRNKLHISARAWELQTLKNI